MITKHGFMMSWDKKLSQQLINLRTSRISIILKDVSFKKCLNPVRYANPRKVYCLVASLKFTVDYARELLRVNKKNKITFSVPDELKNSVQIMHLLIDSFSISFQMPELIMLTLSCILDMLETLLLCPVDDDDTVERWQALMSLEWMLKISKNVQNMLQSHHSQCEGRLKYIRNTWYNTEKNEEDIFSDSDEEINTNPRTNSSLREHLEMREYNMFTNICKVVFNECFDDEDETHESDSELRILSHGEITSYHEIADTDSETSSDSDISWSDL